MKGIIAYYSTTGNTVLACRQIQKSLPSVDFVLHDASKGVGFDPEAYDLVGFATFADELRAPELMEAFISANTTSKGTCAFVVNTYGSISGRTLADLARASRRSGFRVIAAASIHMPENYPPLIKMGLGFRGQPGKRQAGKLRRLARRLEESLPAIESGGAVRELRLGRSAAALPLPARFLTRLHLGDIEFDMGKCVRCMRCADGCPKKAISFSGAFSVDRGACQRCWKCYNLCPTNAVRGTRFKGGFQYRSDAATLIGRLGGSGKER